MLQKNCEKFFTQILSFIQNEKLTREDCSAVTTKTNNIRYKNRCSAGAKNSAKLFNFPTNSQNWFSLLLYSFQITVEIWLCPLIWQYLNIIERSTPLKRCKLFSNNQISNCFLDTLTVFVPFRAFTAILNWASFIGKISWYNPSKLCGACLSLLTCCWLRSASVKTSSNFLRSNMVNLERNCKFWRHPAKVCFCCWLPYLAGLLYSVSECCARTEKNYGFFFTKLWLKNKLIFVQTWKRSPVSSESHVIWMRVTKVLSTNSSLYFHHF